jgi:hypothetical protein
MRVLLTIVVLLVCSSTMGAEQIPSDKEIIYFERSKMGVVTFMH